jgi:hypothetical protein
MERAKKGYQIEQTRQQLLTGLLQSKMGLSQMKVIQLILIVCAGVFSLPGKSSAGDPAYAHVVIDNPTSTMVTYYFKWGANAEWKSKDLQAGYHTDHTYKYNPMGVPALYIQIVTGPRGIEGGGGREKNYKLRIGWDNNPTRYHFDGSGDHLELVQ